MSNGCHILILDEDRRVCESLGGVLRGAGHRVECLCSAQDPFALIRSASPDLLILDIPSAGGRGLEILRRLETHRATRRLPVIATSHLAELEYELLDVFDFLPKPIAEERLLEDVALIERRRAAGPLVPFPPLLGTELERFRRYLAAHSGLHFDQRNAKILERGLMRRMRAVNARDYRTYALYLEKNAESRQELKKLLALLTVGETYFFRYLAHYQALALQVLPELLRRNAERRSLRLWSAGCSTGEEPYSLAMLLLEQFPQLADWDVSILATDINQRALARARNGLYGERALRVTEPRYRQRFFRHREKRWEIDRQVRDMVRFASLNLQTGSFPSLQNGTAEVDVIFCRNVMIYFHLPTTRRLVEKFALCLRPGGYLFLGHAETLTGISKRFQHLQGEGGFFYRCRTGQEAPAEPLPAPPPPDPPPPAAAPLAVPPPPPPRPSAAAPPSDAATLFAAAQEAVEREDFARAAQNYDTILRRWPQHVGALVGRGLMLANQGDYGGARALCAQALAADDLYPQAYFLRGLLCELEEDLPGAAAEYGRALLLDLNFVVPHYHLAKLYWRLGRLGDARRELVNTRRLLEAPGEEGPVPFSGGLSRDVFLEVCREDLTQLDGG